MAAVWSILMIVSLGIYYWANSIDDREQEGDNLYYLGLLFTLTALIWTIIHSFDILGSNINQMVFNERVGSLLSNFGIALISTVAGILARIILNTSQRGDFDQLDLPDQNADMSLDMATRKFRMELSIATSSFAHYNRLVTTRAEAVERKIEQAACQSVKNVEQTGVEVNHKVEKAFLRVAEGTNIAQNAFEQGAERVCSSLEEMCKQTEELTRSLENAARGREQLMLQAEKYGENIGQLTLQYAENVEKINGRMDNTAKRAKETYSELHEQTETLTKSLGSTAKETRQLILQTERFGDSLRQIARQCAEILEEVNEKMDHMANEKQLVRWSFRNWWLWLKKRHRTEEKLIDRTGP